MWYYSGHWALLSPCPKSYKVTSRSFKCPKAKLEVKELPGEGQGDGSPRRLPPKNDALVLVRPSFCRNDVEHHLALLLSNQLTPGHGTWFLLLQPHAVSQMSQRMWSHTPK